jgi:D-alanine-D-alanine ligase
MKNNARPLNILILMGGGGTEHEISLISASHLETLLRDPSRKLFPVIMEKNGTWVMRETKKPAQLIHQTLMTQDSKAIKIDIVIPCIHGFPGETGEIQSLLLLNQLPYLGCHAEGHTLCFNKISTKLWMDALGIPSTPYIFLSDQTPETFQRAFEFLKIQQKIFIKASHQGSSVGCFPLNEVNQEKLNDYLQQAFKLSPYVLIEQCLVARELEVSVFDYQGQVQVSYPSEILCPTGFYSYEEKYSKQSQTSTILKAPHLSPELVEQIQHHARKAFLALKLRHLSRIDFFLTSQGQLYLNEINTFPGLTPISMFPKMMEAMGISFKAFLLDCIDRTLRESLSPPQN